MGSACSEVEGVKGTLDIKDCKRIDSDKQILFL